MWQERISTAQWNVGVYEWGMKWGWGGCECLILVRWLCPRTRLSALGREGDGSFWPRCFLPSSGGLINCLACTDSDRGACPRSCRVVEAFLAVSEVADAVWNGFPCKGCVFAQSVPAWLCLRTSMAFGASDGQRHHVSGAENTSTLAVMVHTIREKMPSFS